MIKHILYAILLGVGMAACLADRNQADDNTIEEETSVTGTATEEDTPATPDPSLFVIEEQRVGHVTLGMPITEMREQVPESLTITDTTLLQEGQEYTAYLLRPRGEEKGILIEQTCNPDCQVWRIQVQSQEYKTPQGVGVGSKFSEVQQRYPISYVSYEEGNLVAVSEEAGISFMLDNSQLPQAQRTNLKPADIPANTLVSSLLVYKGS